VEPRDRRQILIGGVVLVTLGILIMLNSFTTFGFDKSWPILLIVIAITTLAQSPEDLVGWFIGVVGAVFLIDNNWSINVGWVKTYVMPALLIIIGLFMLYRRSKK
jgi:membrane-bound ClpP family serine protease